MRKFYAAGLAFGLALLLFSGCAAPRKLPASPRGFRVVGYEITFPDNTVIEVPPGVTWRDLQCFKDNTLCFDNRADAEIRRCPKGRIYLWRI